MKPYFHISVWILTISINSVFGQEKQDTTVILNEGLDNIELLQEQAILIITDTLVNRPSTAALYSAILPGLGQAYNNKYWKIPLIYAGVAFTAFLINRNHKLYIESLDALFAYQDGDDRTTVDPPLNRFDATDMERRAELYRRNRDLSIVFAVALYLLNIVDAHVDAHLDEFIITDDLSLQLAPSTDHKFFPTQALGVTFALKF